MTTRLTDEQIAEADRNADTQIPLPYWHRIVKSLLAEVRASRSSSGSGEREAKLEAEVAKLTAQRTMTVHRLGGEVEGAPTHAGNFLQRIDALRAIEAASGDRVRVLEEALRESRRCGDKLAKELRGWRDTYVSDDEEDPEGWLALDGWAKSSDARDRALSPQGDGAISDGKGDDRG